LHVFLAHSACCLKKLELLDTVYEGVNRDTHALLEYWDFCAKNVDEACDFLDWLSWDTYEFESSHYDSCIPPPCILTYGPHVCKICHCSDHDNILVPIIFLMMAVLGLVI